MWCRQEIRWRKKMQHILFAVVCFVCFRRWDSEITAPFYMTGSNLLPNCGGLLDWGWTYELCGWRFSEAWMFREGVLKIKLKSEKVIFGHFQAAHHEPANQLTKRTFSRCCFFHRSSFDWLVVFTILSCSPCLSIRKYSKWGCYLPSPPITTFAVWRWNQSLVGKCKRHVMIRMILLTIGNPLI